MTGFTAKHLAVVASLALAAVGPGSTARAETVPVNVCSDQSSETSEDTAGSQCEAGESAIGDQEHQGNGHLVGQLNDNGSRQGNDQGNDNLNDQITDVPSG
jgi:hypothetical protein